MLTISLSSNRVNTAWRQIFPELFAKRVTGVKVGRFRVLAHFRCRGIQKASPFGQQLGGGLSGVTRPDVHRRRGADLRLNGAGHVSDRATL